MKAVVDGCRRPINRRAILPAAADSQHVDDAAQDPPIILTARTRLVLGQQWFDCRPLSVIKPKFSCHDPSSAVSKLESRLAKSINALIEFGP
jgi:hypothetical protein